MLGPYASESRVAEEVVDGEELWESTCRGVARIAPLMATSEFTSPPNGLG